MKHRQARRHNKRWERGEEGRGRVGKQRTLRTRRNFQTHTRKMEPLPLTAVCVTGHHLAVAHAITIAVCRFVAVDIPVVIVAERPARGSMPPSRPGLLHEG